MKILVLNGPNLNLLGRREPEVYGPLDLNAIEQMVQTAMVPLGVETVWQQSNAEGRLIDLLHEAMSGFDGVVFNPGGYTHTSVALRDAIAAIGIPVVEVHLSNVHAREEFRHRSMLAPVCLGQVVGFGPDGYRIALDGLVRFLHRGREDARSAAEGEVSR